MPDWFEYELAYAVLYFSQNAINVQFILGEASAILSLLVMVNIA